MTTERAPVTLLDAVRRGVEAAEPSIAPDLLERFEGRDEPLASLEEPEQEIAEAFGAFDPQGEDPAVEMARAVTTYLAFRRDEAGEDADNLLRLAARAEFGGRPPDHVRDWLVARGVDL